MNTNFGKETNPTQLFVQLDRQLRNIRNPHTNARARHQTKSILTRYVNTNFDLIQKCLEGGEHENKYRLVAAWCLGYATNERALPLCLDLLKDPSKKVVANALFSLGILQDPATPLDRILECLSDEDPGVRCNAARAVRDLLTTGLGVDCIVALTGLLNDEDPRVRLAAVGALSKIARPECYGFLLNALKDPKPLIRGQAALGLGKIGDIAAIPHLLSHIKSERNPTAGNSMIKALTVISGQQFKTHEEWARWWELQKTP